MKSRLSIWHYVKSYKFNSIFIKNLLLIILLVILPMEGIGLGVYNYFNKITMEQISEINSNDLSRVRDMVDVIFKQTDQMTLKISLNRYVQSFMTIPYLQKSDDEIYTEMNYIIDVMNNCNVIDAVESIYAYSEKSKYVVDNVKGVREIKQFNDISWMEDYETKKDKNYTWIDIREMNIPAKHKVLSAYRNINVYDPANMGVIVINLDIDKFGELINKTAKKITNKIYIIDNNGTIIFSSKKELNNKKSRDVPELKNIDFSSEKHESIISRAGEKNIVALVTSDYNKFKFVSVMPLQYYNAKLQNVRQFMLTILLIALVLATFAAFIISIKVFEPVKNIIRVLENPEEWINIEKTKKLKKINELKYIVNNILKVLDTNKKMEQELIYRMGLLKKAEAVALQSQINPHFLYNTLETINWMSIELNMGENKVSDMITDLSKLLRMSLSTEENLVSIRDEIEHANVYLRIQKVRYEDMLEVEWDIEQDIMDYKMVKLTLQPIIENAIYHGIKPMKKVGLIKIKGYMDDSNILIEITDNGVGMSQDMTNTINIISDNFLEYREEHIGISNVNLRNKLILGDEYDISVISELDKGTTFILRLPKIL